MQATVCQAENHLIVNVLYIVKAKRSSIMLYLEYRIQVLFILSTNSYMGK